MTRKVTEMKTVAQQEMFRAEGQLIIDLARKEFPSEIYEIIARTQDYFVIGDGTKNVEISRTAKPKILSRHIFGDPRPINRKMFA
jgi:hypothetical protein